MRHSRARRFAYFIPMAIVGMIVFTYLVMVLWNWLMPAVFRLPEITYWQALGILVLSKIIFGFGGGGGGRYRSRRKWREMRDKWESLTPEEKERFKTEWRDRCRGREMPGEQPAGEVS